MSTLRYNSKTGTWMPPITPRPKPTMNFQYPTPPLRHVHMAPIPTQPAYPLAPNMPPYKVQGKIYQQQFGTIPNRPIIIQPRTQPLPAYVQQAARHGQYAITETLPIQKVKPIPNLPKFQRFSASWIKEGIAKIQARKFGRGGTIPAGVQHTTHSLTWQNMRSRVSNLRPTDLALNKSKGSNSPFLAFGSHLGRTVGNSSPYGIV